MVHPLLRLQRLAARTPSGMPLRLPHHHHQQQQSRYHRRLYHCSSSLGAGHNKWSKIRHKKGANDVNRARAHARAARAVEAASRRCRGDPDDVGLQSSLAAARAVRLPKDRIDRAVERGADPSARDGDKVYERARYDGMVSAGETRVAVIIEALTDSRNRTAASVRNIVTKKAGGGGGEMLPTGANDWLFERAGVVAVSRFMAGMDEGVRVEADEERLLECALDAGATDVDFHDDDDDDDEGGSEEAEAGRPSNLATIRCEPNDLLKLAGALREAGFDLADFGSRWLLRDERSAVSLEGEGAESFDAFLGRLEEDHDVTEVYHNVAYEE